MNGVLQLDGQYVSGHSFSGLPKSVHIDLKNRRVPNRYGLEIVDSKGGVVYQVRDISDTNPGLVTVRWNPHMDDRYVFTIFTETNPPVPVHREIFDILDPPTEDQEKYCSCVTHVAQKQDLECIKGKNWGKGKGCYNPYAVCAKSVGTTYRECGKHTDFNLLTDEELKATMALYGLDYTGSRDTLLQRLYAWKKEER